MRPSRSVWRGAGIRIWIAAALACTCVAGPAQAAHKVVFHDLRALIVETVEPHDENFKLTLASGATMVIPQSFVLEVRLVLPPEPEVIEPSPWRARAGEFGDFVAEAAREYALDPELVVAVCIVESRFDPLAKSPKGALGVMQIMPATAEELGLDDPFDPAANIAAGTKYLREMLDRFDGDLDLALAAYNAGLGRVQQYGGVPPFPETRRYVAKVRNLLDAMRLPEPEDV